MLKRRDSTDSEHDEAPGSPEKKKNKSGSCRPATATATASPHNLTESAPPHSDASASSRKCTMSSA